MPDRRVLFHLSGRPLGRGARRDRLREQARRLRREGGTVTQIAVELGVSRSTVGGWVRGIEATRTCRLCGVPFETTNGNEFACSRQHMHKAHTIYGKRAA